MGILSFLLEWFHNASLHALFLSSHIMHTPNTYFCYVNQKKRRHSPFWQLNLLTKYTTFFAANTKSHKLSSLRFSFIRTLFIIYFLFLLFFVKKVVILKNYLLYVRSLNQHLEIECMHARTQSISSSNQKLLLLLIHCNQSVCLCVRRCIGIIYFSINIAKKFGGTK